jgi:hypothetical protein
MGLGEQTVDCNTGASERFCGLGVTTSLSIHLHSRPMHPVPIPYSDPPTSLTLIKKNHFWDCNVSRFMQVKSGLENLAFYVKLSENKPKYMTAVTGRLATELVFLSSCVLLSVGLYLLEYGCCYLHSRVRPFCYLYSHTTNLIILLGTHGNR